MVNGGEKMFEQDYHMLNKDQKQAVELINKNALILAPAGTGKTKVMAMRSAYLIKAHQLDASKLLCLTFTNKAAKEMKERIELYVREHTREITIQTFHGFCYALISAEKQMSHFSFPCTIIDEKDTEAILQEIIRAQKLNDECIYYRQLANFIENIKRYSLDFNKSERYQYHKVVDSYFKHENLLRAKQKNFLIKHGLSIFQAYQQYLNQNNCIDFMDLIVEAHYLLEDDTIREKWNNRYQYIQVDEMQDTSIREYAIIKQLAKGNNIALFGDFNQTIYEWRGSSPNSMIEDFKKDFAPTKLTLSVNYRSTQVLLNAANSYIRNSQLYPINCIPVSPDRGDKIEMIQGANQNQEIALIAKSIQSIVDTTQSIAVLTRTNEYAKLISQTFQKYHIPCTVIEDIKLFRKKEVKDLLAFFTYSMNKRNNHALIKLCHHPYLGIPKWLLAELNQTQDIYMYLHDWLSADSRDPYAKLFVSYQESDIVVLDVETTGLDTSRDDIIQIAAIQYGTNGIKARMDILVKPSKAVGDSYLVHRLSDALLQEKGLEPVEALNKLLLFAQHKVIVGHNINYDLQIIKSMLNRYRCQELIPFAVYDTLDLAYKVYPKMSNHKLETLANDLKTKTKPNHNAMQDILATSEILSHLIGQIQSKTSERLEKLEAFYSYIQEYKHKIIALNQYILTHSIAESINYMMNDCSFKNYYAEAEIKNLREFYRISKIIYEEQDSVSDNIIHLLAYATMHYNEIEQSALFKGRIPIITIHQSKGLEFDHVYIAGCNDKIFPLSSSIKDNYLEEEKRLFYVGLTRARKRLVLSYHQEAPKSIFINEIGDAYLQYKIYSQNG